MEVEESTEKTTGFRSNQIFHVTLQLLAMALLIFWCFNILAPFFNPILWGGILAVALYPLHQRLKKKCRGKSMPAAIIITLLFFAILLLAGSWLVVKTGTEVKTEISDYQQGKILVPPPPATVKSWPVIGKSVDQIWQGLTTGLDGIIQKYPEQIKSLTAAGLELLAGTGKALFIFAIAIIISGIFLNYSEESASYARIFFNRLIKSKNFDMAGIAAVTIRNVVRGVLGVSIIQSVCAGVGLVAAGIPYAGIWTLLCLILAVIQIGIMPVTVGVLIYIWTTGHTTTAILLTIWMIPVGLLDNILKPLMMGKGAPVPMVIIFLGSLGGFMYSGFIGLFTGAVILSLGYRLFDIWLKETEL